MSSPWMSPALVWAMFLVLLALTLLASLRFDWLKIWWQDQLRQASDAEAAEGDLAAVISTGMPSGPASEDPKPRRRPDPPVLAPRAIQAARAPAHRQTGLWTHTTAPHASVQRTLFHRSGRRH